MEQFVGLERRAVYIRPPTSRIQSAVLGVLEQTAVELLGSTLCADGHVPELGELGVVVELGDFEFANQFGRWIHVAKRAVLTNVNGGRAINGILHLRR